MLHDADDRTLLEIDFGRDGSCRECTSISYFETAFPARCWQEFEQSQVSPTSFISTSFFSRHELLADIETGIRIYGTDGCRIGRIDFVDSDETLGVLHQEVQESAPDEPAS